MKNCSLITNCMLNALLETSSNENMKYIYSLVTNELPKKHNSNFDLYNIILWSNLNNYDILYLDENNLIQNELYIQIKKFLRNNNKKIIIILYINEYSQDILNKLNLLLNFSQIGIKSLTKEELKRTLLICVNKKIPLNSSIFANSSIFDYEKI